MDLQLSIDVIYSLLYILLGLLKILFDQCWANHFEHSCTFLKSVQLLKIKFKRMHTNPLTVVDFDMKSTLFTS